MTASIRQGLWWGLALLLWWQSPAIALEDIGYVTDHLRLSLYSEKGGGEKLRTLESGDVLDLLEESGAWLRVRTATGEEGWVKKLYIVAKPTAGLRLPEIEKKLKDREARIAELEKQIAELKKTLESKKVGESLKDDYEKQLVEANQKNVSLFNEKEQLRKQLDQANLEILHLKQAADGKRGYPAFTLPLAIAIGGLLVGVLIGWWLHVRKLRKRFYGFKM